jgi:2-polyprenyl-3-methyl-5-hydroxy-6-metoxy-1,4-benzoquinol methylase
MQGATVLDVGCGTSILSLFAARGGAAAVVGLDGSERIAGFARQVSSDWVGRWSWKISGPRRALSRGAEGGGCCFMVD